MPNKVAPVPKGFRTLTPCLTVRGVERAVEFYKAAFDAVETKRLCNADETWILHVELKIGNSVVFLNEEVPAQGLLSPCSLGGSSSVGHLYVNNVDEFVEKAVLAGADELQSPTDTYWGDRMGRLIDPFGHIWTVASRIEIVSREDVEQRAKMMTTIGHETNPLPELAA